MSRIDYEYILPSDIRGFFADVWSCFGDSVFSRDSVFLNECHQQLLQRLSHLDTRDRGEEPKYEYKSILALQYRTLPCVPRTSLRLASTVLAVLLMSKDWF